MKQSTQTSVLTRLPSLLAIISLSLFSYSSWAKDSITVQQKDHQFSELFLKVKNSDTIKFVNLDSVNHRLVFSHKGRQEQMNAIKPGDFQEISFSQSGIYDVQCIHHPEMKLTIFVPYVAKLTKKESIYTF